MYCRVCIYTVHVYRHHQCHDLQQQQHHPSYQVLIIRINENKYHQAHQQENFLSMIINLLSKRLWLSQSRRHHSHHKRFIIMISKTIIIINKKFIIAITRNNHSHKQEIYRSQRTVRISFSSTIEQSFSQPRR
jgi:hypothetical protein